MFVLWVVYQYFSSILIIIYLVLLCFLRVILVKFLRSVYNMLLLYKEIYSTRNYSAGIFFVSGICSNLFNGILWLYTIYNLVMSY